MHAHRDDHLVAKTAGRGSGHVTLPSPAAGHHVPGVRGAPGGLRRSAGVSFEDTHKAVTPGGAAGGAAPDRRERWGSRWSGRRRGAGRPTDRDGGGTRRGRAHRSRGALTYGLLMVEALVARRIVGPAARAEGPPSDGVYGDYPGGRSGWSCWATRPPSGSGWRGRRRRRGCCSPPGSPTSARRPVALHVFGRPGRPRPTCTGRWTGRSRRSPTSRDLRRRNDVTTQTRPAKPYGTCSGGAPAARGGRRGGRGHLSRPRHGPADRAAAAWVTRRWSRQLAAAQTVAVVEAAAGRSRSPTSSGRNSKQTRRDVRTGSFPSICQRLPTGRLRSATFCMRRVGVVARAGPARGEGSQPIYLAAAIAAEESGTAVTATRVAGRAAGPTDGGRVCSGAAGRRSTTPDAGYPPRPTPSPLEWNVRDRAKPALAGLLLAVVRGLAGCSGSGAATSAKTAPRPGRTPR